MPGLSLYEGILLYLGVWLGVVILLWVREVLRLKNFQWELTNRKLFHCDNCHLSFLNREPATLTRCPRCNAICIRRKIRH
ncbi:MAG: hypothetical protein PHS41_02895 [Victivallaceae bacterium]|nr:hypothetical protein [Victivallaceae bacterium]